MPRVTCHLGWGTGSKQREEGMLGQGGFQQKVTSDQGKIQSYHRLTNWVRGKCWQGTIVLFKGPSVAHHDEYIKYKGIDCTILLNSRQNCDILVSVLPKLSHLWIIYNSRFTNTVVVASINLTPQNEYGLAAEQAGFSNLQHIKKKSTKLCYAKSKLKIFEKVLIIWSAPDWEH